MADYVGQQFGNYRLVRLLGEGGFAQVYLGEHLHLKSQAAIKVLHARLGKADQTDFLDEARTIARLKHPHIVRVLDFGVEEGLPYLVMEYAANGTLRARYPRGARFHLERILPDIQQVAEALHYAHEQRLIHRDIKPENMLLDERFTVVLSDFGIATGAHSSHSQQTEAIVGTVSYMAPEQLQGKPRTASDQYALGIVVYEWLTGTRPFQGSFTEVASQHLLAPPPPLRQHVPDIAPAVEEVVLTALAKDYKARFVSVRAFAAALEQASQSAALLFAPTLIQSLPPSALPTPASQTTPADEALLFAPTRPGAAQPTALTTTEVARQPPTQPAEAPTAVEANGATAPTIERPVPAAAPGQPAWPQRRPRATRPRRKRPALIAAGCLLLAALGVSLLLAAQSPRQTGAANTPTPGTAAYQQTLTAVWATSTAQSQALNATATAQVITPYNVPVPGPCDTTSGAIWHASGSYQCLSNALLLTANQQDSESASVDFDGRILYQDGLPVNYNLSIDIGQLQGNICATIYPTFEEAANTQGTLTVDLCSNHVMLVYADSNPASSPIYNSAINPAATYTVTLRCKMPTCAILLNGRRVASANYTNVAQVYMINFAVNSFSQTGTSSVQLNHFTFAPAA